jgi:Leucine-rich repeat (LRR) protein
LIVRRCKEDNFLSLVNDVEALVEAQDRVIRRLTVAGRRDAGDSKVDTSIAVRTNISQVRSLAILEGSNWIPTLNFKHIRVCVLLFYWHEMRFDLTCINQLSTLRYLEVGAYVAMPGQIRGLRYLETLDLSRLTFDSIPREIIDVPRLSHLVIPPFSVWNMTGKMKSLCTFHGFVAPHDSSESIVALGELTALSDLQFYLTERWALLEKKTECVAALSNSLEKLCNLKRLVMSMYEAPEGIAWCADELSSLSPAFRKLEHLRMSGCRFSRVPKWIGHLQKLRVLDLGAKQIFQEDVAIIGRGSSSLIWLSLQITSIPTERIVIGGSTGFPLVKVFDFDCDGISYLTFEEGAMPELRELRLAIDTDKWDKAAPGGLQHLPSLEKIQACWSTYNRHTHYNATEHKEKRRAITAVFQEASGALLTRPDFTFYPFRCRIR